MLGQTFVSAYSWVHFLLLDKNYRHFMLVFCFNWNTQNVFYRKFSGFIPLLQYRTHIHCFLLWWPYNIWVLIVSQPQMCFWRKKLWINSTCLYLLSTIFWYSTLARNPLHLAWVRVISWASLSSRISSRSPRRPALKKTWAWVEL